MPICQYSQPHIKTYKTFYITQSKQVDQLFWPFLQHSVIDRNDRTIHFRKNLSHTYSFDIHIVEVILYKLDAGVEISRVELVGNIPPEGTEFPAFLHGGMQEGHTVQHGFPLRHVGDVEEVLRHTRVRTLQTGLDALRRLVGEFDRHLAVLESNTVKGDVNLN